MIKISIDLEVPAWYLTRYNKRYTLNMTYEECLKYKGEKELGISLDYGSYTHQISKKED